MAAPKAITCGAHPRVCGEHQTFGLLLQVLGGSSPRLRGALGRHFEQVCDVGLIPASAGSTPRHWLVTDRQAAHPRVCGEHSGTGSTRWRDVGSSPRLRGARDRKGSGIGVVGLIPASAGSTTIPPIWATTIGAHPRVCGEHTC